MANKAEKRWRRPFYNEEQESELLIGHFMFSSTVSSGYTAREKITQAAMLEMVGRRRNELDFTTTSGQSDSSKMLGRLKLSRIHAFSKI